MDLSVRSSAIFASIKKGSGSRDDLSDHSGSFRSRGAGSDFDSNESDTLNDDDEDQDDIADIDDIDDQVPKARKPFHPLDLTRK